MRNGKCLKCNSTKVYKNTEPEFVADGDSVELYDLDNELKISLTPYVYVKCGFVAMFVEDADEITDLPDEKGGKRVN